MKHYILLIPLLFVGYHLPVSGEELQRRMNELNRSMGLIQTYKKRLEQAVFVQVQRIKKLKRENQRLERQIQSVRNGGGSHGTNHWNNNHDGR